MFSTWGRLALTSSALVFAGGAFAAANCRPPAPTALLERFTPADCETCWQAAPATPPAEWVIVLDWIVPAADGAPMAAAALPEATERAVQHAPTAPLPARPAVRLRIADGPAWNGYVGLQLTATRLRQLPAGATAYAALVERVPAGSEGTPVARQLVRAVVGPMTLQELAAQPTIHHLRAVRLPETERPERLASVAWAEDAAGRVIAATQSPPAECMALK
ncbi:MAG TPA: hypothetical protein VJ598_04280 [Albitalea sp.]|nr:hypothetical protein [Albitalea sp.]